MVTIEKQIRQDTPQVSVAPYKQIHAHSTVNPSSTAQNEADYMNRKDLSSGFYTHVVGNGRIIQTARTNRGAWDVGGSWNNKTYAAVELIESHKTQAEFDHDYKLYVELLRQLAKENGIPIQVDCGVEGINTHYYCTYNQPGNKSDHIDPYPYLQKWGISKVQFKKDVENGFPSYNNVPEQTIKNQGGVATMYALYFVNNKAYFYNGVTFGYVNNPDGLKIIRQVYRDNNGKDIPEYHWKDGARFDLRLTQPILDADKIKEKFGLKNEWD